MREEFVSRQQVKLLRERIRKAEESDATEELISCMWNLFKKKKYEQMNIMIVGTGGSYPAAIFVKHVLHYEMRTPNVEAVTPQTADRILTQFDQINGAEWNPKYDLVIGISYSGKTPDIKHIAKLCTQKGFPFLLVTGAEKSTLTDIYCESASMKVISYYNSEDATGKEKGMISMAATLAPIIIFDDNWKCENISKNEEALINGEKFVANLNVSEIAQTIERYPIIHVFYEWDTLPTATDIESKFTKSGIANVILHEKKNFSNGRYTSLYNQNFALVINLTRYELALDENKKIKKLYKNKYDENLAIFLNKRCEEKSVHYIEIGTGAIMPAQWNIEAMSKLPYLITAIGEELGIDISKPLELFPEEVTQLYDYKGEFF